MAHPLRRIVVVVTCLNLLNRLLTKKGHSVVEAVDGEDAVAKVYSSRCR